MIHYLIYASTATDLMSTEHLMKILDQSRKWNSKHHITGMLLYVEGNFLGSVLPHTGRQQQGRFIQLLEGGENEVKQVFSKILKDKRHHDLIILKEAVTADRCFKDWAMGFKDITVDDYRNLSGYFKLDNNFLKNAALQDSHIPLKMLKSFYKLSTYK